MESNEAQIKVYTLEMAFSKAKQLFKIDSIARTNLNRFIACGYDISLIENIATTYDFLRFIYVMEKKL
jgi:hypothetical protein